MVDFGITFDENRRQAMHAAGHWDRVTPLDHLERRVAEMPDRTMIVDRGRRFSYGEMLGAARRIAGNLAALGVGRADVVAVQLPNWWEMAAMHFACLHLGAVVNPLMPIFRRRELSYMLAFAEAKVLVCPEIFRGFDHAAMAYGLARGIPCLEHVLVVGRDFEDVLLTPRSPPPSGMRTGPDEVMELMYTSGTTGEPKGVLHTPNTALTTLRNGQDYGEGADGVIMMSTPLAHQTGFLWGINLPVLIGARVVYQDAWDPGAALALMARENVTFMIGATPFLSDLAGHPDVGTHDLSAFRTFVCAGAPIPRVLMERAGSRLGVKVASGWGMSENGLVTGTRSDDPPERVTGTDGRVFGAMEIAVVDPVTGAPCGTGEEGLLKVRGPSLTVGYLKRPELLGLDDGGWFDTGDLASKDGAGYIRITGRAKDIVIRGGENVPVVEVEDMLHRHPAVEAAAVVGVPDARLGERACACLQFRAEQRLAFADMVAYLEGLGIARNYLPEFLLEIAEMPRTPSGKIQKFRLRKTALGVVASD